MISDIVVAFLENNKPKGEQLIAILNGQLNRRWLPQLIRYDLLFNLETAFLTSIRNILVTTSPSELQNQLILPYSLILRNPQESLNLLAQQQLLQPFCTKLIGYAKLFKGTHLRITTLNVLASMAGVQNDWIRETLALFDGYGVIESNEWQDEEDQERLISQYFSDVVNEEVEKTFKNTFGELAWDSNLLAGRIAQLRQMI